MTDINEGGFEEYKQRDLLNRKELSYKSNPLYQKARVTKNKIIQKIVYLASNNFRINQKFIRSYQYALFDLYKICVVY
ncbi:unnamed protein product [Paramecium octaurelia]|uniref:Uncharacterized protein n=1 Tax=Paramecium octaurelia TaxID=43137 RepID=A0A8S1XFR3_PAROT|nr:unnamed protein product [Paramecium octaurelia]